MRMCKVFQKNYSSAEESSGHVECIFEIFSGNFFFKLQTSCSKSKKSGNHVGFPKSVVSLYEIFLMNKSRMQFWQPELQISSQGATKNNFKEQTVSQKLHMEI